MLCPPVVGTHCSPSTLINEHLQDQPVPYQPHYSQREREREILQTVTHTYLVKQNITLKNKSEFITALEHIPGNVPFVRSLDTQTSSSSPPAQSAFPSHAFSIETNLKDPEQ